MTVFKTCSLIICTIFLTNTLYSAEVDWSKVNCPKDKEAYVDEAIKLIVSGYLSNKESICLKQEDFKYFNVEGSDIGDKSAPKPFLIDDNYKTYILEKTLKKGGYLEVAFRLASGLKVETDKFTLYYTFDENGKSTNGCAGFFELPSKMILKKSCQEINLKNR